MAYFGQPVTIQPKAARLTHDTAIFKMDPYVVVWIGGQSARTPPNWDGGRHPHWNEVLTLYRTNEDSIRFVVYDRDSVAADEFVGEGHFHFSRYAGGFFEEWIPLHYRGRQAGELHVNIQMNAPQQPYAPPYQPGYPQPSYPQPGYPQPGYPQPGYPQPGYPQPGYAPPATVIVEERGPHHHHGHHGHHERVEEVIVMPPPQPYQPYPPQPMVTEVIVEREGHHHHHHQQRVEEVIITQPQYPGQPYPPQPYYRPPY